MSARRQLKYYFRFVQSVFFCYFPLFLRLFFLNYYLSCSQTRNRNTERRSADVIHADLVAKLHAVCIATIFAANADLQLPARLAALLDAPTHQHAYTFDVG